MKKFRAVNRDLKRYIAAGIFPITDLRDIKMKPNLKDNGITATRGCTALTKVTKKLYLIGGNGTEENNIKRSVIK